MLEADKKELAEIIAPFPLLNKNAVESLRYRAQVNISFLFLIFINNQASQDTFVNI